MVPGDLAAVPQILSCLVGGSAIAAAKLLSCGQQGLVRAGPLSKKGDVRKQVAPARLSRQICCTLPSRQQAVH